MKAKLTDAYVEARIRRETKRAIGAEVVRFKVSPARRGERSRRVVIAWRRAKGDTGVEWGTHSGTVKCDYSARIHWGHYGLQSEEEAGRDFDSRVVI